MLVAVIDYGLYRALRPEAYRGQTLPGGLGHHLGRVFLHFDFGPACSFPGCPPVREIWARGRAADVYLLIGALLIGVTAGLAGRNPRGC